MIDQPMLLIDNEADNASINTAQFTSRVRPCYVFCEIRGMD